MIDFDVSFTYENEKEETLKGVKGTIVEGFFPWCHSWKENS